MVMSDSQDITPFISCSFELIPNMTQDRFELSMVSLYLFHIICKAYEFLLNFDCSVLNMQPFIKKKINFEIEFILSDNHFTILCILLLVR